MVALTTSVGAQNAIAARVEAVLERGGHTVEGVGADVYLRRSRGGEGELSAIGVNLDELARPHVRASPTFRAALHKALDVAPAALFAGESRKSHDAKVAKLEKAIAEREAELAKRDRRRSELERELERVGAGETS